MLFDDNKIEMTRKAGKKQKENPVGAPGKVKDEKRKYKRRVERRKDGNHLGGELTPARLALTKVEINYNSVLYWANVSAITRKI